MCFIDFYDSLRDLIVILVPLASLKRYGLYKGLTNVSGVEFYVIWCTGVNIGLSVVETGDMGRIRKEITMI